MKDAKIYETEIDQDDNQTVYFKEIELIGFNKKVLEFGCSTGFVSNILKQRGCNVTGIEIDENAALKASEYCNRLISADIDDIDLVKELGTEKFDVALFGDILEHLKDPRKILKQTKDFLSKEGYIVVSVPNIAHWSVRLELLIGNFDYMDLGILDDSHLKFFTKKSIKNLLESCGYFIESIDFTKLGVDSIKIYSILKMKGLNELDIKKISLLFNEMEAEVYQYIIKASVCSELKYLEKLSNENRLYEQDIKEKKIIIEQLFDSIKNKDTHIKNLEAIIHNNEAAILDKDEQIKNLNIYKSKTWKMRTVFRKVVDAILSSTTKRKKI